MSNYNFEQKAFALHDLLFRLANSESEDWRVFDNRFKTPYPMDIWHNSEFVTIEIPILDGNLDQVKIVTTNDELTITRSIPNSNEKSDKVYEVRGIVKRPFSYKWRVSSKFDLSKLSAEYRNGLLVVSIPYAEAALPKEVKIINYEENWKKVAAGESLDKQENLQQEILSNFKENINNR